MELMVFVISASVTAMLLVVLQAAKARIHFGVLWPNALLRCLRISLDMLWYDFHGRKEGGKKGGVCFLLTNYKSSVVSLGCWLST